MPQTQIERSQAAPAPVAVTVAAVSLQHLPAPQFALTPPNENSAVSGTRKWRKARSSKVKVRRSTLEILALALAPAQPNSAQSSYDSSLPKLPQKTCQLAKTREKSKRKIKGNKIHLKNQTNTISY